MRIAATSLVLAAAVATAACGGSASGSSTATWMATAPLVVSSNDVDLGNAVTSNGSITAGVPMSRDITCDGKGTPPVISWGPPPAGARELVVVFSDSDQNVFGPDSAGPFVHWLVYGISPNAASLENAPAAGIRIGFNGDSKQAYKPPCPPIGRLHHYLVTVSAYDTNIPTGKPLTEADLERNYQPHLVAEGTVTGYYGR